VGGSEVLKIPAGLQLFDQYEVEMPHDELGICLFVTKTTLPCKSQFSFLILQTGLAILRPWFNFRILIPFGLNISFTVTLRIFNNVVFNCAVDKMSLQLER
jgi:hypothetical protein